MVDNLEISAPGLGVFFFPLRPAGGDPGLDHLQIYIFWQFVFPWVDLALLKPMKTFPWEKCVSQATKNKAKSCSFCDAIRRCSCGRSADWLKIDGREIPVSSTLETGRYATVRFASPSSSHLHFEALLSLLGSSRKPLKTKFTPAVSSVYSLSLSLSLSLSPREHTRKKNQSRLSTVDPSNRSQSPSSKFILSSLDFAFNMRNSNCALDEDSAGVTIVGLRTNLGVPALTYLLPQTSLNVATRSPELTQLAVADSKEKKNFRAFSGDPAMGSCVLANDVAVEWCRVRITVTF